jgi:hypothetical protein
VVDRLLEVRSGVDILVVSLADEDDDRTRTRDMRSNGGASE